MIDVDVPELLERLGIRAERRGRELWAVCPYPDHEERTPSWHIRDEPGDARHGRNHCHGCELGGSAVFLVMRLLGLDGKAAWRWIRDGKAIAVRPPKLNVAVEFRAPRVAGAFRLPAGVVVAPLAQWVTPARRHVVERGVTEEQVERWGLGYAVDGRLKGRVVLPVRDARGRLTSYTGRTYVGGARKYLEPREEEGADKAAIFGEQFWPAQGERSLVIVFEGGFNALAGERATGMPVAAIFGSQFLPGHAAKLSTFKRIILASDPDAAGDKLAAASRSLARWCKVDRATFPEGFDANDLERQFGAAELARVLGVPVHGDRGGVEARPGAGVRRDRRRA